MMKKFTIALLSAVFVVLIACSVQSISADDSEPRQESTKDSKYELHVQVVVRNADNQVVSVAEAIGGMYVHHKMTDNAFDTSMGKKKIVTVDGIKYEKVQFYDSSTNKEGWDRGYTIGLWVVIWCDTDMLEEMNSEQDELECLNIFQARTDQVIVKNEDVITAKWTILRAVN